MASDTVSVIIPAFNEERTLAPIIQRTHKTLRDFGLPYEIIIVDDGSTDGTSKSVPKEEVLLVSTALNKGKGRALDLGISRANGSIIITMDADGSHQPEEIPKLLRPMLRKNPGATFVVGSRFTGSIERQAISRLNFAGNKIFNLLITILTGESITDSQSGFRAYRREVLNNLRIKSSGFAVETEMLLKVLRGSFKMKEVPITCRRRAFSTSRLSPLRDGLKILGAIITDSLGMC